VRIKKNSLFKYLPTCADMDAWDGYRWVDGWPVSPPKQKQQPEQKPQEQELNEHEMAEEKEPSPSTSAPTPHQPTQHSTQVFSNKNVTPSLQDGSEYSGSRYVTPGLRDSEDDYDAEQDR
jgi:hypothetical protein